MGKIFSLKKVYAHCDIPCGIYDPHTAQISALTVLRMLELMQKNEDIHNLSRYVSVKEKYAEQCKDEIRILWGDFFNGEHSNLEAGQLAHEIMHLASKAKQGQDIELGKDLVTAVNHFAELFWAQKGIKTKKIPAPYKVEAEIVIPEL